MYTVGSRVQIMNHAEPACNGQYGTVMEIQITYNGYDRYYMVELDDSQSICACTDDELMEG